ncbi:unnamed protein product [Victoria cruziana]
MEIISHNLAFICFWILRARNVLDKSSTGTILQCPCRQRIGASVFFFGSCWTNGRALEPMEKLSAHDKPGRLICP